MRAEVLAQLAAQEVDQDVVAGGGQALRRLRAEGRQGAVARMHRARVGASRAQIGGELLERGLAARHRVQRPLLEGVVLGEGAEGRELRDLRSAPSGSALSTAALAAAPQSGPERCCSKVPTSAKKARLAADSARSFRP